MPTTSRVVVHVAEARRRPLAIALIAFGLLGIGLIVAGLLVIGNLSAASGRPDARGELIATLDSAADTLSDAELAARDTQRGLVSGSSAAGSAGTFMGDMAATLRTLAGALQLELPLVGGAPFAAVSGQFQALSDRAAGLATDLDAVRSSLDVSATDLARLADGLGALEDQVDRVRAAVDEATGGDALGLARLLAMAMLGWLAIPAVASLALGLRLLRPGRRPRAPRPGG